MKMKSNEALYKAIGEIKEEYLPDIDKKKRKPLKLAVIGGLTAAAVVLGIFLTQGAGLINNPITYWEPVFPKSAYDSGKTFVSTEKLSFQEEPYRITSDSYSYTKTLPQNSGNPWNKETAPDTLPIFKDPSYNANSALKRYYTEDELRELTEKAAAALGISIVSGTARQDDVGYIGSYEYLLSDYFKEKNMPLYYTANCNGEKYGKDNIVLTVSGDGHINVAFCDEGYGSYANYPMDPLVLPEGCSLSENAAEQEIQKAADYIIESFNDLFQYEDPAKSISWYEGKQRSVRVFDTTDNNVQNILNYNFSFAEFYEDVDRANSLASISLYNKLSIAEYLGDYPLLSPEEAEEMLINDGYYLYDYKNEKYIKVENTINDKNIKKIELEYAETDAGYYVPYYTVYAEEKDEENGGVRYRAFTVPAVREEYFESGNTDFSEEILNAAPDEKIKAPDGGTLSKGDVTGTDGSTDVPVLEFDVGFFRFAKTIFFNTVDYPDCYDFEAGKGKAEFDMGVLASEWYRVKSGDIVNSELTVKKAETKVTWHDGEQDIFESRIEFDGTLTVEGFFCCSESDTGERTVAFIPDPTKGVSIPVVYTSHRESGWQVFSDNVALLTDTQTILLEEGVSGELLDCFDSGKIVKGKASIKNIVLSYNESGNEFAAELVDFET